MWRDIYSCGFYSVNSFCFLSHPSDLHCTDIFQIKKNSKLTTMALQPTMDAPKFKGTAVVDGQFKEISLDDYKGAIFTSEQYPMTS